MHKKSDAHRYPLPARRLELNPDVRCSTVALGRSPDMAAKAKHYYQKILIKNKYLTPQSSPAPISPCGTFGHLFQPPQVEIEMFLLKHRKERDASSVCGERIVRKEGSGGLLGIPAIALVPQHLQSSRVRLDHFA